MTTFTLTRYNRIFDKLTERMNDTLVETQTLRADFEKGLIPARAARDRATHLQQRWSDLCRIAVKTNDIVTISGELPVAEVLPVCYDTYYRAKVTTRTALMYFPWYA